MTTEQLSSWVNVADDTDMPVAIPGKTAIITGSSQGWGFGIAKALGERGIDIVITGATPERVAAAARQASEIATGKVVPIVADISTAEGCESLFNQATEALGLIEILVNNAGKVEHGTILEMTEEQWNGTLAIQLTAQFRMTQRVARALVAADKGGRIINMAGGAGFSGLYRQGAHAASKAGGMGAVLTWARELGPHGITVNALAGRIDTASSHPHTDIMIRELAAKGTHKTARELGYWPPEELTAVALWLASDAGAMVNGRMVHCSGPELQIWRMATIENMIYNASEPWTPEMLNRIGFGSMLAMSNGLEPRRSREQIKTVRK